MNGDGLFDRVFAGNPMRVSLNTGNGFAPPVDFHGSLSGINGDRNAKLGGGVYFTIPICFIAICIIINPGADTRTGASRSESRRCATSTATGTPTSCSPQGTTS